MKDPYSGVDVENKSAEALFSVWLRGLPIISIRLKSSSGIPDDIFMSIDASEHKVGDQIFLTDVQQVPETGVELANGQMVTLRQREKFIVDFGREQISLGSVYYIPGMKLNNISCSGCMRMM